MPSEIDLKKRLKKIRKNAKLIDEVINVNWQTGKGTLTKKQVKMFNGLLKLFRELNWQIKFNDYKELKFAGTKPIVPAKCGRTVKIRPCAEKYNGKTYFGIYLGEVALSIQHSIDDKNIVTAKHCVYNPAIFVPELNEIIYGIESWWGEISSEAELSELITDETIKNVWYMKLLVKTLAPVEPSIMMCCVCKKKVSAVTRELIDSKPFDFCKKCFTKESIETVTCGEKRKCGES